MKIIIKDKLIIKHIYFGNPSIYKAFSLSSYFFSNKFSKNVGFEREVFYSKSINLKDPLDTVFNNFKSNTRNEIRKAERIGVKASIEKDVKKFVRFFNCFAESKNRRKTNLNYLAQFGEELVITKTYIKDNSPISMHAYIINKDKKTCILFMSASIFRNLNKEQQKIVGYANRLLHYKDIEYFKNCQLEVYDLGGYKINAKENSEQFYINRFKDQFGGVLIEYSNYTSSFLILSLKFYKIIRKYYNLLNVFK
jgi:lipid II:glycine glycyltransferase (peptidoglycan interpeptide bridge formation enzyme)